MTGTRDFSHCKTGYSDSSAAATQLVSPCTVFLVSPAGERYQLTLAAAQTKTSLGQIPHDGPHGPGRLRAESVHIFYPYS